MNKEFVERLISAIDKASKEYPIIIGSFGSVGDINAGDDQPIKCMCPLSALYYDIAGMVPYFHQSKRWTSWQTDELETKFHDAGLGLFNSADIREMCAVIDEFENKGGKVQRDAAIGYSYVVVNIEDFKAYIRKALSDE